MRNSILGMLVILITACNTTSKTVQSTKSENILIPIPFPFNYFPFAAFAIQDKPQEFSARVQVEYAPDKKTFEYSVVTRHKNKVIDKTLISEHELPDIFQFTMQWSNDSLSVTPHIKEVGDGWFRYVPSKKPLKIDLQFNPYSYAYLASGSQGRFVLFAEDQNILNLNKQAVRVEPIQKNDL